MMENLINHHKNSIEKFTFYSIFCTICLHPLKIVNYMNTEIKDRKPKCTAGRFF